MSLIKKTKSLYYITGVEWNEQDQKFFPSATPGGSGIIIKAANPGLFGTDNLSGIQVAFVSSGQSGGAVSAAWSGKTITFTIDTDATLNDVYGATIPVPNPIGGIVYNIEFGNIVGSGSDLAPAPAAAAPLDDGEWEFSGNSNTTPVINYITQSTPFAGFPANASTSAIFGNASLISGDPSKISGNVSNIQGSVTAISGNVTNISGFVGNISGNVSGLRGSVSALTGSVSNLSMPTRYEFTLNGPLTGTNATYFGATYSNNNQVFTVCSALTSADGTTLICSGTGAPSSSGTLTRLSGPGIATLPFISVSPLSAPILAITGRVVISGAITGISGNVSNISGTVSSALSGVVTNISGNVSLIRGNIDSGLSGSVTALSGDISLIRGTIQKLRGFVFRNAPIGTPAQLRSLSGDISGLTGDVTGIYGDATGIFGDLDALNLTAAERAAGVDIQTKVIS